MPNPIKVELEVGDMHEWCRCFERKGLCPHLSICSRGDNGDLNGAKPMYFTADRTEAYLCTCLQTKTPPYCDGSHKQLSDAKD